MWNIILDFDGRFWCTDDAHVGVEKFNGWRGGGPTLHLAQYQLVSSKKYKNRPSSGDPVTKTSYRCVNLWQAKNLNGACLEPEEFFNIHGCVALRSWCTLDFFGAKRWRGWWARQTFLVTREGDILVLIITTLCRMHYRNQFQRITKYHR